MTGWMILRAKMNRKEEDFFPFNPRKINFHLIPLNPRKIKFFK